MTRQRFITITSAVAALGGAAWVTKVAVLAATDGDDTALIAFLYLAGALGITLGSTWVGVRLARERPLPVVVLLAALCPIVAYVSYSMLIDPLAKAAAGDGWFDDEAGILATGLLWIATSVPAWLGTTLREPAARRA